MGNEKFKLGKDLSRDGRFRLPKDVYTKVQVNLSWDTVGIEKHGLTGLDLDASAFLVGDEGVITNDADFVYYRSEWRWLPSDPRWNDVVEGRLSPEVVDVRKGDFEPYDKGKYKNQRKWRKYTLPVSKDGGVIGSWDDPGGEDDDNAGETMRVNLDNIDDEIREIIFCVSIYPNPAYGPIDIQTFDKVNNARIEIKDEETGSTLCSYNLKERFVGKTAVEVARLTMNADGDWEFVALGDGHDGGLQALIDIYA